MDVSWIEWRSRQQLSSEAYRRPLKRAVGRFRSIYRSFAKFCNHHGWVLDIGCGPSGLPSYAPYPDQAFYLGIDPIRGSERPFPFIVAVAEHLPFRDRSFDQCACSAALDHLKDPDGALAEANRILRRSGELNLLQDSNVVRNLPEKVRLAVGYVISGRILDLISHLPEVARWLLRTGKTDPFHTWHPTERTLTSLLERNGFRIASLQRAPIRPEKVLFIKARRRVTGELARRTR